jgi:hypothetical protein
LEAAIPKHMPARYLCGQLLLVCSSWDIDNFYPDLKDRRRYLPTPQFIINVIQPTLSLVAACDLSYARS